VLGLATLVVPDFPPPLTDGFAVDAVDELSEDPPEDPLEDPPDELLDESPDDDVPADAASFDDAASLSLCPFPESARESVR
jgi:hypothetical protein